MLEFPDGTAAELGHLALQITDNSFEFNYLGIDGKFPHEGDLERWNRRGRAPDTGRSLA
jgi:hypothetical protein